MSGESDKDSYGHPRIPFRGHYDVKRCNQRRRWAEKFTSASLEVTGEWWNNEGKDDSVSCTKLKGNIENPIGLTKIPTGIVGPLLINGDHVSGYVICPFATTEGALVASATRGAALLTRSGGVRCRVINQNMFRSPVFVTKSLDQSEVLYTWILMNKQRLQEQVTQVSQFATLIDIDVQRFGRNVVVVLKFTTSDAAGQNMVTSAAWHLGKWTVANFEIENPSVKIVKFFVESLLTGDKRSTMGNYTSSRGIQVIAEAYVPKSVIESTFKTTVEDFLCLNNLMQAASRRTGSIGHNVNVANTLTSIFTATGQDIASVVESASSDLIIEPASYSQLQGGSPSPLSDAEGGIYVCLVLPSLVIGTVGGGTGIATQMECLKMMDCYGTGKVYRFAEIIAGFALSLDLSTLASLSNGTFALSHEKLGKNRPESGLKETHINDRLFESVLKGLNGTLISWTPFNVNTGDSILSELAKSERLKKKIGHFGFKITYQNDNGQEKELSVVLKSKPIDTETCNVINKMAQDCGFSLATNHEKYKRDTGFKDCHVREISLATLNDVILQEFTPKVYHTIFNAEDDIFVYIMEYLNHNDFSHIDTASDITLWTIPDIKVILRDLAKIHAHFMIHQKEWLHNTSWLHKMGGSEMKRLQPMWIDLLKHAQLEFPSFWTTDKVEYMRGVIDNIPQLWSDYESAPKTLSHNDCNPRNVCIRKPTAKPSSNSTSTSISTSTIASTSTNASASTNVSNIGTSFPYNDSRKMCIYDWELARIDMPQHDLAEFLAFSLPMSTKLETRLELIEFYRKHFVFYSGMDYTSQKFLTHYNIACLDLAMNRLPYYTMAHTYKDYQFLPRVVNSHFRYIFQNIDKFITVKKSKL